jgi:hypothetical protein
VIKNRGNDKEKRARKVGEKIERQIRRRKVEQRKGVRGFIVRDWRRWPRSKRGTQRMGGYFAPEVCVPCVVSRITGL